MTTPKQWCIIKSHQKGVNWNPQKGELEEEAAVFQNRMNDLLMRAIQAINANKQYKMIVTATALLDADESLNLTEKVLAKVNELYAAEKKENKK